MMDIPDKVVYKTWDDLYLYCYRVASTVGLMTLPVMGTAPGVTLEAAKDPAVALGIALQITNILRCVCESERVDFPTLPSRLRVFRIHHLTHVTMGMVVSLDEISAAVVLISLPFLSATPNTEAVVDMWGMKPLGPKTPNFPRDVGEDARDRGRIYLPVEDLEKFGVTEEYILTTAREGGEVSEAYKNLMKFEIERAMNYYRRYSTLPGSMRRNISLC